MIAALLCAFLGLAHAGYDSDDRQKAAETSFDTIMLQNAVAPKPAPRGGRGEADGWDNQAPATVELPQAAPPAMLNPYAMVSTGGSNSVEVPLLRYELTRAQIAAGEREAARSYKTLVVLGESTYTGRAVDGGLALHLQIRTTLMGPGFWKAVPLVGEEVAVVSARVGSSPIALTNQNGYQVWVTDAVGELTLDLDILVPARGPRGSLEYDFLVARTPVTRFDCAFSDAGLEPKLDRTVRASTTVSGGATRLEAWLEPTSRIHLVGFKAMGEDEERAAKVYVETLSLLSIEESSAELFTVLRYNILQAGTRKFDILVPSGFLVVSADGDGAFRYTPEQTPDGTVLHGETAFPIRDAYEVSLRVSRSIEGGVLDVQPPRALNVEREHGWLGMEVLGTVQIEEKSRENALAIDVAQLPQELVGNAVSPVLQGWRYHANGARVLLNATRLPEREPAAGSIDEVRATTTIAAEGRARTELKVTLRNRLRHSLSMRLPDGVEIRSCSLDGQTISPSKDESGLILLPLKRSVGERPAPFSLQLVLEGQTGRMGVVGIPSLDLPTFGLPVSSLIWDVRVPAANLYTRLYGDIAAQGQDITAHSAAADQKALHYARYWVAADRPISVRFAYLRGWLRLPLALVCAGLWVGATRRRFGGSWRPKALALTLALGALWHFGGGFSAFVAVIGATLSNGLHSRALERLRAMRADFDRAPEHDPAPGSWRAYEVGGRLVLLAGTAFVGMVGLIVLGRLLMVLSNPL